MKFTGRNGLFDEDIALAWCTQNCVHEVGMDVECTASILTCLHLRDGFLRNMFSQLGHHQSRWHVWLEGVVLVSVLGLCLFLCSRFHLACTSTSLGAISLRFHPVSFHAAVCCQARGSYIVPGATLLGAVLIWYTVNRLLQQALLHKPRPFYGFVFVFLSSSSSPSLFCSLAGFHLECTSNSLGATSLWPAGLPKAIKYDGYPLGNPWTMKWGVVMGLSCEAWNHCFGFMSEGPLHSQGLRYVHRFQPDPIKQWNMFFLKKCKKL